MHVIKARAVIMLDDKVFLTRDAKKDSHRYFLPGGTVEMGESVIDGLRREITEELGKRESTIGKIVAIYEYVNSQQEKVLTLCFALGHPEDFTDIIPTECSHGHEYSECGFYSRKEVSQFNTHPKDLAAIIWDREETVHARFLS